jgi:hypothetical protein
MIDILYVSFNRHAYVQQTFPALLANTDWSLVSGLYIADDASTDGAREYLIDALRESPVEFFWLPAPFHGPVSAMNLLLDATHDNDVSDRFAKIDSDFIVCPGWLPEVLQQMTIHPGIDVFGLQPRMGPARPPPFLTRTVEQARFIGGIGAIRHRMFELCRPRPSGENGRQGWTQFQTAHDFKKAWITPDLPCFCLDLLPFEPWISQAAEYVAQGWMRAWPAYDGLSGSHWNWWSPCA